MFVLLIAGQNNASC